jgi:hypothetical protein
MANYKPNKAISTRYHGYNFRSRLEARWAVVFETLGLDWRYEVEGWRSPSGDMWLPDFLLEIQGKKVWVEIKPPGHDGDKPRWKRNLMIRRMVKGMSEDEQIWAIAADIPDPIRLREGWGLYDGQTIYWATLEGEFDMFYGEGNNVYHGPDRMRDWHYLCICTDCSTIGIHYSGSSERIECGCSKDSGGNVSPGGFIYTSSHPTILNAYAAARAARFEHEDREVWSH